MVFQVKQSLKFHGNIFTVLIWMLFSTFAFNRPNETIHLTIGRRKVDIKGESGWIKHKQHWWRITKKMNRPVSKTSQVDNFSCNRLNSYLAQTEIWTWPKMVRWCMGQNPPVEPVSDWKPLSHSFPFCWRQQLSQSIPECCNLSFHLSIAWRSHDAFTRGHLGR